MFFCVVHFDTPQRYLRTLNFFFKSCNFFQYQQHIKSILQLLVYSLLQCTYSDASHLILQFQDLPFLIVYVTLDKSRLWGHPSHFTFQRLNLWEYIFKSVIEVKIFFFAESSYNKKYNIKYITLAPVVYYICLN